MKIINKALILAAGFGSRLLPITERIPKSLVPVNGKPILFKQIESLIENGVDDITIIAGYKAEVLKNAVLEKWPLIHIVESVNYANTNNMFSALLGIKAMFPKRITEPFIMMNADVFFDASVLTELVTIPAPNAIVVDIGRYLEESMKVVEKNGRLVEISKEVSPKIALGSSIDVYKFDVEGGKAFYNHCVEYIEIKKQIKLWSEVALNDALADQVFTACPLKGRWLEIDNQEDLIEAIKVFSC